MSRRIGGGCSASCARPAAPEPRQGQGQVEGEGELEGAATVTLKCGFVLHMCV